MAQTVKDYFARIVALAYAKLKQVQITQEINVDRSILTIQGTYSIYRIAIKETFSSNLLAEIEK